MDREILYIWLSKIRGVGPILAGKLLNHFGDVMAIYSSDMYDLLKVEGIGKKLAETIIDNKDLDESKRILEKCQGSNIKVITKESINYPNQLKGESKSPIILYVRGELKKFESSVAVVG